MDTRLNDTSICWWCGSKDLSREHKFKKTDLDLLYGKSAYPKNKRIALIKHTTSSNPIPIQSSKSDYLKFKKTLCENCNNSRSADFDKAYEKVISYYLENDKAIKSRGWVDMKCIFGDEWEREKGDFFRYCVKHVCSRLVESNIQPSVNLISFLNYKEELRDIKFVFQIKNYKFGEYEDRIDHLYLGPMNVFSQHHLFIGEKLTSVASWYTIKQLSINYVFKKYVIAKTDVVPSDQELIFDIIKYNELDERNFSLNKESMCSDYMKILEVMEYFPFDGANKKIDHYNYILNK